MSFDKSIMPIFQLQNKQAYKYNKKYTMNTWK